MFIDLLLATGVVRIPATNSRPRLMDAERWRAIWRLYQEALERPVDERRGFLACAKRVVLLR